MDDPHPFDLASDPRSGQAASLRQASQCRRLGFIGNCQAELLQKVFERTVPASHFKSFYHFFHMPDTARERSRAELAACDELLVQDVQDFEHYELRDSIPSGMKITRFPFLRFASPWPYDDFNGLRDGAARAQDDPEDHTTTYYDGVLGRLRRLVPEPQARFDAYKALDLKGIIDPARVQDFEARRLEALDERFGCSIGRFILAEFRKTRLFYTVNRPCGALLAMVLDYISRTSCLDLPAPPSEMFDELRSIQVPVHPLVARLLSIEWASDTTLYQSNGACMTWEGFVRAYIDRYG
jgi:hypothetical protein